MQVQSSTSRATLSMFGFQMIQWGIIITEDGLVIAGDAEIQVKRIVFIKPWWGSGTLWSKDTKARE